MRSRDVSGPASTIWGVIESGTAALIGAGVASVVAVGSQFLYDDLASRRDRKAQRRDRLHAAITEAGLALYATARSEPPTEDELAEIEPGTVGAAIGPEVAIALRPHSDAIFKGLVLLQVHLGHSHPLVDEYVTAWEVCTRVETAKIRDRQKPAQERVAAVTELAEQMRDAQVARDQWMTRARAAVDRL